LKAMSDNSNRFFVYVDYRADTGVPFYVGKGNKRRISDVSCRNVVWGRTVAKHGLERRIIHEGLDNATALERERELICELKTRNSLGGANLTDGGEGSVGWNPSKTTRERMGLAKRGKKLSCEHCKKLSESHKRRYKRPGECEKIGRAIKALWADATFYEKMCRARSGEKNGRAVLTWDNVDEIRAAWSLCDASVFGTAAKFCREYASRFGVTTASIGGIIRGKSWRRIPAERQKSDILTSCDT